MMSKKMTDYLLNSKKINCLELVCVVDLPQAKQKIKVTEGSKGAQTPNPPLSNLMAKKHKNKEKKSKNVYCKSHNIQ